MLILDSRLRPSLFVPAARNRTACRSPLLPDVLFRFSFPQMMTDTTDLIEFRARGLDTRVFNPARERIEREKNKRK
jgi:hypothetical protein